MRHPMGLFDYPGEATGSAARTSPQPAATFTFLEGLPEDVANRLMVSFTRIADRILSHAPPTES